MRYVHHLKKLDSVTPSILFNEILLGDGWFRLDINGGTTFFLAQTEHLKE
jgi:hypothetical protein